MTATPKPGKTKQFSLAPGARSLSRATGAAAAIAGALFIAVQVGHPAMDVSAVTTTDWAVRSTAKALMAALALAGITGMYLRQVRQTGIPGFLGYVLFAIGYLSMLSVEVVAAAVLPALAHTAPGYVAEVLAVAFGGTASHGIGAMQTVFVVSSAGYLAGGCLFGIALFRARVLARWASALLAAGTVATLALAVLPESFNRPLAVPTGVALIGLGISLWRAQPAQYDENSTYRNAEYAAAR
jgi:hypothetical protein